MFATWNKILLNQGLCKLINHLIFSNVINNVSWQTVTIVKKQPPELHFLYYTRRHVNHILTRYSLQWSACIDGDACSWPACESILVSCVVQVSGLEWQQQHCKSLHGPAKVPCSLHCLPLQPTIRALSWCLKSTALPENSWTHTFVTAFNVRSYCIVVKFQTEREKRRHLVTWT